MECFNRDSKGRCLAYTDYRCYPRCPARIKTIDEKITLIECLLQRAQSRKEKRKLQDELKQALAYKAAQRSGKYEGWMSCYLSDMHRGEKGGASEGDSNRSTGMKALLKDNRPVGVKPTRAQQEAYKRELQDWEENNEKLDRLGRSGVSHSKIDSYTGVPICFSPTGEYSHKCKGQRSSAGNLMKSCKECPWLKKEEP